MDIQFQICSLIIVSMILVIYGTHKRLMLRSERVFYRALFLTTVMLFLDILTISTVSHIADVPAWLPRILCKAFESVLILCSGTVLIYMMADVLSKEKYRIFNRNLLAVLATEIIVTCTLPLTFSPKGYAEGLAIHAGYGWFVINFSITLAFLARSFNKITRRRRFGIMLWIGLWVVLSLIEMYNPEMTLVSLAVTLGILLMFGLLEKPESKLERQYGCFNYFALMGFLDEMVEEKTPISIISVSLKTTDILTGDNLYQEAKHVLKVLEKNKDMWIFRGVNQDFVCVAKNKETIDKVSEDLEQESKQFPQAACYARITRSYDNTSFTSADEIIQFLNFIRNKDTEQNRIFDASAELMNTFHKRKIIEVELRNALIENRVEVFLQPIYSTKEKRITSCEALARIRKTDGSILMPGDFIPVAEDNGSILELGYKIFEQTCNFIAQHGDLIEYVEVNLSVVQCEDEDLSRRLIEIMEHYRVAPQKFNLEITETASIVTKQKLLKNMERMLEYGVTFSLDDFGKGESNLMYVVDMPISIVKLDFDMSKSYFRNEKAKFVVNAVEQMAHGLNLKLVAEGIETAEELAAMEKQKIDYIQGYYFSKPLPQDQFVEFVQNYNKN